jgi:catechol 2,3-dioxygenase-like lactoylglutathione lyase family enzyme
MAGLRLRVYDVSAMSLAHLTLPTREVEKTAAFFERTLGYRRLPVPTNSPVALVWLDLGRGQEMHVFYVEGFTVSPFESEFGRHVALFYPLTGFDPLKRTLEHEGAEIFPPMRPTPFERFFFREPVNGYVFEVIDENRKPERR